MEELARWYERPPNRLAARKLNSPSSSEANKDWTKSSTLRLSRYSDLPKTPCPSPDLTYDTPEVGRSTCASYTQRHKFEAPLNHTISKRLIQFGLQQALEAMVQNRFDHHSGRLADPLLGRTRRRSTHTVVRSDSSLIDAASDETSTFLNETKVDPTDRRHRSSVDTAISSKQLPKRRSSKTKKPKARRKPDIVLRTISPKTFQTPQSQLRPGHLHVPGSYRSEDTSSNFISAAVTPGDTKSIQEQGEGLLDHGTCHDQVPMTMQTAGASLSKFSNHDSLSNEMVLPSQQRDDVPVPNLQDHQVADNLKSVPSFRQPRHYLLSSDKMLDVTARPTLSTSVHALEHRTLRETRSLQPQNRPEIQDGHECQQRASKKDRGSVLVNYEGQEKDSQNRPSIVSDIEDRDRIGLSSNVGAPPGETFEELRFHADQEYPEVSYVEISHRSPMEFQEKPVSNHKNPEVKSVTLSAPWNGRQEPSDVETVRSSQLLRIRGLPGSSGTPSIGRLIFPVETSKPKEASDAQDSKPVMESQQYGKAHDSKLSSMTHGSVNEALQPHQLTSFPSIQGFASTNETANLVRLASQPNLRQNPSCQSSDHLSCLPHPPPASRLRWIQQLLGRKSDSSLGYDLPNLTTKPKHRQGDTEQSAQATTPLLREHPVVDDVPGFNDDTADTASDARYKENTASFTKVICNLESLLKEALQIARQVADNEVLTRTHESVDCTQAEVLDRNNPRDSSSSRMQRVNFTSSEQADGIIVKDSMDGSSDSVRNRTQMEDQTRSTSKNTNTAEHVTNVNINVGRGLPIRRATIAPPDGIEAEIPRDDLTSSFPSLKAKQPALRFGAHPNDTVSSRRSTGQNIRACSSDSTQTPFTRQAQLHTRAPGMHRFIHPLLIEQRDSSSRLHLRQAGNDTHGWEAAASRSADEEQGDGGDNDVEPAIQTRASVQQWVETTPIHRPSNQPQELPGFEPSPLVPQDTITTLRSPGPGSQNHRQSQREEFEGNRKGLSLKDRHHLSIHESHGFSLSRSHRRAPIARDWSLGRKRFVAAVTCISTALIGMIIGIYAGEVPAIQYSLGDEHHYTILGNVVFFIGMAIPTALFFPLPLLHGRKPYTLASLAIFLPLQFPQAVIVGSIRSPYVAAYRVGLLFTRSLAGFVIGFTNMNLMTTLLDLFGASLQSGNPHQETVNENDVRRHGGGMGIWLGIWTWCSIGSIGVGFLIGAAIIQSLNVSWGFWITIILTVVVMLLNVLTPEVRRSPYRRSMAEVRDGPEVSRRIARGEIMMHLYSTGPKHWWEEVLAGHVICVRMLLQPGFIVLSVYLGWVYGQVIMIIVVS